MFCIVHKNLLGRIINKAKSSMHWTQVLFRRQPSSPPKETDSQKDQEESRDPLRDEEEEEEEEVSRVAVTEVEDSVVVDQLDPSQDTPATLMEHARILTLREKKLMAIMGPDAVQYLRFQKYIILYVLFTTLLSCCIILPLNMQGTNLGNSTNFGHFTVANLDLKNTQDGNIMWVHIVLGFLMFPAAIFLMRRFSYGLKMTDISYKVTRTLGIEKIPEALCTRDYLLQHFTEAYPDFPVQDIRIVHNVARLVNLQLQLDNVMDSIKYCRNYKTQHGTELDMVPVACSRCSGCFCLLCVNKVNSLDYFLQEKVSKLLGRTR